MISKRLTFSKCFTCILVATFCFEMWNIFEHALRGVRKIAPRSGSGFGFGLALELGLGGIFPRGQFSLNRLEVLCN